MGVAAAIIAVATAVGVVIWASGIGQGGDGRAESAAVATYVGAATCARCHADQHAAWAGSDHDRAMQVADASTVLGDFDGASFTHFGVTSTFSQRDGKYFVRTDGPDGELRDYEVAYTFGVDPLQQYLIALPGGRLQALSVCWDARPEAEGGQRWFHLYPGEPIPHGDLLHWTGRNQSWNAMCADCHSTNLRRGYDAATDTYATTWSELDVACEACHGPGSEHIALVEAAGAGAAMRAPRAGLADIGTEAGASWVLDPGAVTARRVPARSSHAQVESCAPCHARRTPMVDAPEPGARFLDRNRPALLDEGLYRADGQIHEEVYEWGSFVQSKMYHAGVTCTDCHDPHSLRLRVPANDLCTRCHSPQAFDTEAHHHHVPGSPGASCVECHMPSQTYMVVDPRRDHSLRVPRPDLSVTLGTPNACNGCHAERSAQWAAEQVVQWYGPKRRAHWADALHAGRTRAPGAGRLLQALAADPAQPAIARATAVSLFAGAPDAPGLDALRSVLRDGEPLVRHAALGLLDVADARTRLALALPLLADPLRLVRAEAARVLAPAATELQDPAINAAFERARDEWRAIQHANADWPWAHVNLGVHWLQLGDAARAEREYRTALRLAPWSVEANTNLADLYREQGRDAEGERVLRAALALVPDSAELHHVLGMALVRMSRMGEALEELERAARLRPQEPRFAYAFGLALDAAGDPGRALAVLDEAHRSHPGDRDILLALATRHRDRGEREAALRFARKLAALGPDPTAHRLLEELERGTR